MARRSFRASVAAWFVLIALLPLLNSVGMAADPPDFRHVLRAYEGPLAAVASEAEAKALFVAHLAQALSLKDMLSTSAIKANTHSSVAANHTSAAPDLEAHVIRLTADLAGWRLATTLKHTADVEGPRELRDVMESTEPQRHWLIEKQEFSFLSRAARLASVLSSLNTHAISIARIPVSLNPTIPGL
jgi:hypothetical protein